MRFRGGDAGEQFCTAATAAVAKMLCSIGCLDFGEVAQPQGVKMVVTQTDGPMWHRSLFVGDVFQSWFGGIGATVIQVVAT